MVLVREPSQSYVLEANRDITARKSSEQKLAESFVRKKTAREMAEAAVRAKDGFLAMLSHELRTPLNPVLLIASDCATNPEVPVEMRDYFQTILTSVETEVRLIDDLLDLSRISHGKLKLNLVDVDTHDILEQAMETVRNQMESKAIRLNLNLKAERYRVFADPVRLQQVFWNILKNAAKFTPAGGSVTAETQSPNGGDKLILKISDTGIGMTPEELNRIFSAFAQGDHIADKSSDFGGLGLGLAISKKLVELHAGHIQATSEGRNKGSLFTIELPLS
jgi:signal transduction histidine kinase